MRCNHLKYDNLQCEANSMTDVDYCFSHNPEMQEAKRAAAAKGGKAPKKNYNILPIIELHTTKDIFSLLSTTINEVRSGEIDIRVANCIGFLSGHLIKAYEASCLEERITAIEERLKNEH